MRYPIFTHHAAGLMPEADPDPVISAPPKRRPDPG